MTEEKAKQVKELKQKLREAKGPSLWKQMQEMMAGSTAYKFKTMAFLAVVGLLVAWLAHMAFTTQLDAIGLMVTHFLPFAVLLSCVVALAMVLTYAVVYLRNSDCFDRHNATTEARKIRDRLGTPDEKNGDAAAVADMYRANTGFIIGLIGVSITAFIAFVAISAFAPMVL